MRRADLKIIYMTGFDLPHDEALGKVLRKPVLDTALVEEVRQTLAA